MVGDFSKENGLPGTSSVFFDSDKDGISSVDPLLGPIPSMFPRPRPELGAQDPSKGMRSLGHGEAEPFTTRKDPNLSAPS